MSIFGSQSRIQMMPWASWGQAPQAPDPMNAQQQGGQQGSQSSLQQQIQHLQNQWNNFQSGLQPPVMGAPPTTIAGQLQMPNPASITGTAPVSLSGISIPGASAAAPADAVSAGLGSTAAAGPSVANILSSLLGFL